jgi:enamine deaminase RidA (YjgF/YER057c/UK114 family)
MTRTLISSGSKFETEMAYSRAVVDGDWIFVSGTTGFNYATMEISDDVAAQAEQTFLNIKAAMEKAGFGLEHIVRVHYILPKAEDFPDCWPVLRKFFGDIRPAATMFVAALADPRMKIEIEVTGKRSGPG